jgi:hypothetical protein
MADDNDFFAFPSEDDDVNKKLAGLLSPVPAQQLVPTPPNSPPQSGPGQSTPRTGSLDYSPTQAQPKVSGPPMLPGIATQPENLGARNVPQPVTTGAWSGSPKSIFRDLNGNAAGSPQSAMPVARSGIAGAVAAQLGGGSGAQPASGYNVSPFRAAQSSQPVQPVRQAVQPVVQPGMPQPVQPGQLPYQPGVPLAAQQAQRTQDYTTRSGPARFAASQTPVSTDMQNPDPGGFARPGGTTPGMTTLPQAAQQVQAPSQLDKDQARLNFLTNSGSGVSQIQNPVGRVAARIGDSIVGTLFPGIAANTPGFTAHHQQLVGQAQGLVSNDQAQAQAAAQTADTRSQMNERDAMGRRYDAQANLYNPEPISAGQAQALGHPEWEGLKLDARDAERLVGGAARNQTTLQTHFGGQQRTLSSDDAAAIGTPSLEGANMSNDEYQRLLQGAQHNQQWDTNNQRTTNQSDVNNRRTNSTRVTTTGMRDDTSEDNSNRAHPGGAGGSKPIPPAVRDRIESQKATAINKARGQFENGESSQDEYLDNWQQAQNEYEERIGAQTGQPVQHLDIRSNVDNNGNWKGNRSQTQPAGTQPQTQTGKPGSFVTRGGSHVAVGDPVKVGRRTGKVTGFNAQTGKAQVKWDGN